MSAPSLQQEVQKKIKTDAEKDDICKRWQDRKLEKRLTIHPEADKSELLDNVRAAKSILRYFPTTTIKIREHVLIHKVKNPEYLTGGHIADRKGIRGEKGIKNAFLSAITQGCEAIVIDLDMNIRTLNIKRLTSHLYWRNSDFASNIIKRCYVIYRNQAIVITKDDMDKNKITE